MIMRDQIFETESGCQVHNIEVIVVGDHNGSMLGQLTDGTLVVIKNFKGNVWVSANIQENDIRDIIYRVEIPVTGKEARQIESIRKALINSKEMYIPNGALFSSAIVTWLRVLREDEKKLESVLNLGEEE
jgi:hypothetical protein